MSNGVFQNGTNTKQGLETVSVRRAKLADAGKVRYRVYTTPSEFIAVIAESALMAVKVSGVSVPYKIMRDLPTDGIAIEAQKMAEIGPAPEKVSFRLTAEEKPAQRVTEMEDNAVRSMQAFVPVGLADLRSRGGNRARILPPELVNQIIEEHKAQTRPEEVAPPPPEPVEEHETVLIAEPELSAAERITLMANELPQEPAPQTEAAPAVEDPNGGLTPEEVEKLLNG